MVRWYLDGIRERRTGRIVFGALQLRALRVQKVLRVHDDRCCENGHQALRSVTGTEPASVPNGAMRFIIFQPSLRRNRIRDRLQVEIVSNTRRLQNYIH